uniref:Protein-PII uridylyltransferase N-terminal domain-containing protein n=1 Tax=Branchiostoma floridae TaxID=7739 RepID=C3Z6H0_BRAFL|eukprot:XP_002595802.1 hypothetical protein BRAFLDRAFT_96775 [Branchiostoma floridae]
MLRVCEKLREVDAKTRKLGLVCTETNYLRALQDAMANMDRCTEVEVLKTLGDVNLEKGRLYKNVVKFDRAILLYRAALLRCEYIDMGKSLEYRYQYAKKLRVGKKPIITTCASYASPTSITEKLSLAKVAEKLGDLDRRFVAGFTNESVLIGYTNFMIEGIVNGDNVLEVEAIKSLGDVYLKRGTETGDAPCLTKAAALYNTALARCGDSHGRVALIHRLLYTARIRQEEAKRLGNQVLSSPLWAFNPWPCRSVNELRSAYQKYLTAGDRALTDGNMDLAEQKFVSSLKLIHDPNKPDRCKEAECLCRLGDVYVRRGKRTKQGRKFTQAAALYNASIARTKGNKDKLVKRLQETEQMFLQYAANVYSKGSSSDRVIRHRKRLWAMRSRAKVQLEAIDQQHNPYQYDENDPVMITVEAERAEAVKGLCKSIAEDRRRFIKELVDESIELLGTPPCKYAFIGLGSQATELVTPYSDLEFAILIEDGKDNDDTRRYFITLTHYLHLKVINLGETILPAMAIPSLNDFLSDDPEKDWFYDSVTPRGFAFDGFMPWAKGYHLAGILKRVVFLTGEKGLVNEYVTTLMETATGHTLSHSQSSLSTIQQLVNENSDQFFTRKPTTGQLLNVKKDIYRFPDIAIEVLALCYGTMHASAWSIIDELTRLQRIDEEDAAHLMILTSISAELRLRTYNANGGQKDNLSPLGKMMSCHPKEAEISENTLKSIFHIPDTRVLFRYYSRAVPLKKCILTAIKNNTPDQPGIVSQLNIFDTSNLCQGRIARNLFLPDKSICHLEAALNEVGDVERPLVLYELGKSWTENNDDKKAINYYEEALKMDKGLHGKSMINVLSVQLLHSLGASWIRLGDQHKAISYFERSLKLIETIDGDNTAPRSDIANVLSNLSLCWSRLGNQMKAINYQERSMAIRKSIYGENTAHPHIALSLLNLGSFWSILTYYRRAISYVEQSLMMMKIIYGDNTAHPYIAQALASLGTSWYELCDQKKAIHYYEQSLSMRRTIYGDNMAHPDIHGSLLNLGSSWKILGHHHKANSYYERSLMMVKSIYGDNAAHPDIAQSLHSLGASWFDVGDPKKAMSYLEQSLAMRKSIYGENTAHPDIVASLTTLGGHWSRLGNQVQAINYCEQSLAMGKTMYGDNNAHPDIANSLYNLGRSWGELGDQKKAIHYCDQSLRIWKFIFGNNTAHPDIARTLNALGSSWNVLGDLKKAMSYFEQSLVMEKIIHGGDNTAHPSIAMLLSNIGACFYQLGDKRKAINYFEQSLTMRKTIYGNTAHPDIAQSLLNMGTSLSELGDKKRALRYYEQSLSMSKSFYGDNTAHPDIAKSLQTLGSYWSKLGDQNKAISYFEQALTMRTTIYGDNKAHPEITASLYSIALAWRALGDERPMECIERLQNGEGYLLYAYRT